MNPPQTRALRLALPTRLPTRRAQLVSEAGERLELDGSEPGPLLVGTGPACALRLTCDTVSRRHCTVELLEGQLRVVDQGSTNGTRIDGVRVESGFAQDGSVLGLGAVRLRVAMSEQRQPEVSTETHFGEFRGMSTEVRRLHPLLARVAASRVPTLLEGETGTGKEVLARALHEQGPRAAAPFVLVDATIIPVSLAESELFGHEKGAFTGAVARRVGAFEEAHGGTLFLDEVGDLEPGVQAKLLRAIDRGEWRPVGATAWRRSDVRIIAATRRDLDREVAAGRFRDDLYHRLVVARVLLPPLRQRQGDVVFLARHFCAEEGVSPDALPEAMLRAWAERPWAGNVRELRLAVHRFLALGIDPQPTPGSGGDFLDALVREGLPLPEARRRLMREFEQRYVTSALRRSAGNVSEAARSSGVARRHFQTLKAKRDDDE